MFHFRVSVWFRVGCQLVLVLGCVLWFELGLRFFFFWCRGLCKLAGFTLLLGITLGLVFDLDWGFSQDKFCS